MLLAIQAEQNPQDMVEATKIAQMLDTANYYLNPFRDHSQRLDSQAARGYLNSPQFKEDLVKRFLLAVVALEEKTLTVAQPFDARIQPAMVGNLLLVELGKSRQEKS